MGIVEWMQDRIERNAVISELGGERVILKKSKIPFLGGEWKEIHPPVDENGNVNWGNLIFGGWKNFFGLVVLLSIVGMAFLQYLEAITVIEHLKDTCIGGFMEVIG